MAIAQIVVFSSALVTLLWVPCAVTAVRRAVRLSRRTLWGNASAAIAGAFRTATAADPDLDPAAVATRLEGFIPRDRRTEGLCVPYLVDHAAYSKAFGGDATPLRESIRQTVAWARSNPDRAAGTARAAHAAPS